MMNSKTTPYFAVIFTSKKSSDTQGYALMADKMAALSAEQTGFLGMTHATTDEGESVTTCYWQDEAAILNWKHHPEHQVGAGKGFG